MPKIKISNILHRAADNWLTASRTNGEFRTARQALSNTSPYICDCVGEVFKADGGGHADAEPVIKFLKDLGMDTGFDVFNHIPKSERQGTRFDFLNLAALVADDENLTV